MKRIRYSVILLAFVVHAAALHGQEKKHDKKDGPRVTVVVPLGAAPGATTKVTVRGLKLDAATGIHFLQEGASARILTKGKAVTDSCGDGEHIFQCAAQLSRGVGVNTSVELGARHRNVGHPLIEKEISFCRFGID